MTSSPPNPHHPRLPWSILGAALIALAALYVTGGRFKGMPIFASLIIAAQFTRWRLAPRSVIAWVIRIPAFIAITMIVGVPEQGIKLWYILPEYTDLIGYLLSAELVVRAWQRQAPDKTTETRGIILLLTALIITAAANTQDASPMRTLVPVYLVLVVVGLRWFAVTPPAGAIIIQTGRPRWMLLLGLRATMLVLALFLGSGSTWAIKRFEPSVSKWFVKVFEENFERSGAIGLAKPRLGIVANPKPSPARVLIVEGSATPRHLRVSSYEIFDNDEWTSAAIGRAPVRARQFGAEQPGPRLRFVPLSDLDPLPVPLESARIEMPGTLEVDATGCLRSDKAPLPYTIFPGRGNFQGPLCAAPVPVQLRRLLTVPETIEPRVSELAKKIAGDGDPMSRVTRLVQFLRSQNGYSLSYQPAGEPLSDFVLNRRSAHCQYFASALVVMSRAAGVPARMVTGYYAHEAHGDQLVVRQRDAHAWAEVWIEGAGWITADATPAGGLPSAQFQPPTGWIRTWEWIKDIPRAIKEWLKNLGIPGLTLVILLGGGGLVIAWTWRAWKNRRRTRRPADRPYAAAGPQLVRAAARFERLLKRRGIPCPANITWRQHVQNAPRNSAKPLDVELCARFFDIYDEARFGGENGQTATQVHQTLDKLEKA